MYNTVRQLPTPVLHLPCPAVPQGLYASTAAYASNLETVQEAAYEGSMGSPTASSIISDGSISRKSSKAGSASPPGHHYHKSQVRCRQAGTARCRHVQFLLCTIYAPCAATATTKHLPTFAGVYGLTAACAPAGHWQERQQDGRWRCHPHWPGAGLRAPAELQDGISPQEAGLRKDTQGATLTLPAAATKCTNHTAAVLAHPIPAMAGSTAVLPPLPVLVPVSALMPLMYRYLSCSHPLIRRPCLQTAPRASGIPTPGSGMGSGRRAAQHPPARTPTAAASSGYAGANVTPYTAGHQQQQHSASKTGPLHHNPDLQLSDMDTPTMGHSGMAGPSPTLPLDIRAAFGAAGGAAHGMRAAAAAAPSPSLVWQQDLHKTPIMAQMRNMPIEAAVNAPLLDSSPFPDDMDTR